MITIPNVTINELLEVPSYDDTSNAPQHDGSIVHITGEGPTTPEGLYQRTSGTYTLVGTKSGVNIEDSGSGVVSDAAYIDFEGNLLVSDNGDGGVTVTGFEEDTVDVEDGGSSVVVDTNTINFGSNLSVVDDGSSNVTVSSSGGGASVAVEDDGTEVLAETTGLNFGDGLGVTDDGDDTVTIDAGSSDAIVANGTHTVDSSGGSGDITKTVLSLSNDGKYAIYGYPDNPSNIAAGSNFATQVLADIGSTVAYFETDGSWAVQSSASADTTTGPVDIKWFVYDMDVLNSSSGGASSLTTEQTGALDANEVSATVKGTYTLSNNEVLTTAFDGQYAYHYDDTTDNAIVSYDLADPNNPSKVGEVILNGPLDDALAVKGSYVYAGGQNELAIIDSSDPTNLSITATYSPNKAANGVAISNNGDYAYLTTTDGLVLEIVDISDKTAPSLVNTVSLFDAFNDGASQIVEYGGLAYLRVKHDGGSNHTDDGIYVVDVSDPNNVAMVGTTGGSQALNTALGEKQAYENGLSLASYNTDSIRIVDTNLQTLDEAASASSTSGSGTGDTENWRWWGGNDNGVSRYKTTYETTHIAPNYSFPNGVRYDPEKDVLFVFTDNGEVAKYPSGQTAASDENLSLSANYGSDSFSVSLGAQTHSDKIFAIDYSTGNYAAINKSDLTENWTNSLSNGNLGTIVYTVNNRLYISYHDTSNSDGILAEIDPSDGSVLTTIVIGDAASISLLANSNGDVIAYDKAFSPDLSTEVWSLPSGNYESLYRTIGANDKLFVSYTGNGATDPAGFYKIDALTGTVESSQNNGRFPGYINNGEAALKATPEYVIANGYGYVGGIESARTARLNYDQSVDWVDGTGDVYSMTTAAGQYSTWNFKSWWPTG